MSVNVCPRTLHRALLAVGVSRILDDPKCLLASISARCLLLQPRFTPASGLSVKLLWVQLALVEVICIHCHCHWFLSLFHYYRTKDYSSENPKYLKFHVSLRATMTARQRCWRCAAPELCSTWSFMFALRGCSNPGLWIVNAHHPSSATLPILWRCRCLPGGSLQQHLWPNTRGRAHLSYETNHSISAILSGV